MKKLDFWDYAITISYLVVHIIIFSTYYFDIIDKNLIKESYFIIGIVSTYIVYDVLSVRLRKKVMFIIWAFIGLLQIYLYFKFRNLVDLKAINGTYIDWLIGVPVALLVSLILNIINKNIYGDHFIVTTFRLNSEEIIPNEGRKPRPIDFIFSIIGFIVIIITVTFI